MKLVRLFVTLLLLTILASACSAKRSNTPGRVERESGALEAVPGFTGDRLGIVVEQVIVEGDGESQVIDLNLPLPLEQIDEVEVLTPSGDEIEQKQEAEIAAEPDERGVGVRLYLPKSRKWEFRLRLIDLPEVD